MILRGERAERGPRKHALERRIARVRQEDDRQNADEPVNVEHIAKFIADLRGITLDEVAEVTTHNAIKLFQLNFSNYV
jgi:Tat protein secretion system quality control protein TatD with DNase activity